MLTTKVTKTILIAILATLALVSLHFAINRIFQVDEIQNAFMARIIGDNTANAYYVNPEFFLLGPLAWLAKTATSSSDFLITSRLIFLCFFWINILLTAKCAGADLKTTNGLLTLTAAATIAPVWDYGFEIRHENIVLTGMLITMLLFRDKRLTSTKLMAIGAISSLLLFVTFKSIIYTGAINLIFLFTLPALSISDRLKNIGWVMLGAVATASALTVLYIHLGLLDVFFRWVIEIQLNTISDSNKSFLPWATLWRAINQAPLLTALIIATLALFITSIRKSGKAEENAPPLPEVLVFLSCLAAIFINPNPYPYNLVNLLPFAIIASVRYFNGAQHKAWPNKEQIVLATCIAAVCHFTPFLIATARHTNHNNWRQISLVDLAEKYTDQATDTIFDATGMVITRKAADRWWFLHSLTIDKIYREADNTFSKNFEISPPKVVIRNYRFDWLSAIDKKFVEENYIALADDFFVLGGRVINQHTPYLVRAPGKYQLLQIKQGILAPVQAAKINGEQESGSIFDLTAGPNYIEAQGEYPLIIIWIGNKLTTTPSIPPSSRYQLFVNWY